jgi:hypothetical protein
MRRDNEGMDVITRTEFDDAMKKVVTKEDLQAALADTKSEIVDVIQGELGRAWLKNKMDIRDELTKAKLEILSVNKKNIADAVAPVTTRLDELTTGQAALGKRVDVFGESLKKISANMEKLAHSVEETLQHHEDRLNRAGL